MTTLKKLILVIISVNIISVAGLSITSRGCYDFLSFSSDFSVQIVDDSQHVTERITNEYCANLCAGYQYMGIVNNQYCYCGNTPPSEPSVAASMCNRACLGDSAQKCGGGGGQYSVFEINIVPSSVAGVEDEGCYKDETDRDVNGAQLFKFGLTQELCAQMCSSLGYSTMGLQNGVYCFCGDSFGRYGSTSECNVNCSGNSSQTCGGNFKNTIFTLTRDGIALNNDPHFMMSSGKTNFCFNLHGKDEEIFNLISDSERDITVRGETFETVVNGNLLSYFSKIGIYAKNQEITFGRNEFQINGQRFNYDGYVESPVQVDDITITLIHKDPYKFIVKIGDDIKLMVTRSSNQHTDGFMGVYLLTSNGFTNNINGIIGELIDTNFILVEDKEGMKIEFDDHHESVPVSQVSMFSPDSKGTINCYFYSGVLGNKTHYQESTLL